MRDTTVTHQTVARMPVRVLRIEVLEGPDRSLVHTAGTDVVAIGTAPGNDLLLSDETVSRYHAELSLDEDGVRVKDLGSRNGVVVKGVLLESGRIPPGTVLTLGRTAISVDDGGTVDLPLYGNDALGRIRGRTAVMRRLMATMERAAKSDVPVLVLGETGVGKEVMAQAIHDSSARAEGPFETVDCGSLLPTLVASELFGHEKGAFTGADEQHVGAFERAHGGTLFLDEIGEIPTSLQPVLLGALERRAFRRVGGKRSITTDVRVVCATNRDLREEVNRGTFRQDLYYRIAVVTLQVPPLRERSGDIPLLVEHFLREAGYDGRADAIISARVMESIASHRWPGNVRELRNFVEATLAMGEAPPLVAASDLAAPGPGPSIALGEILDRPYKDARTMLLDQFERAYLERLLERTEGNVAQAARAASMARSYLNEMLRRHKLR